MLSDISLGELSHSVTGKILCLSFEGDGWEGISTNSSQQINHFDRVDGDSPLIVEDGLNGHPIIRFNGETTVSTSKEILPGDNSYTIFSLARYSGDKRGRVLSSNNNWLSGFHSGNQDSLFLGKWFEHGVESSNDWVLHTLKVDHQKGNVSFRSSGREILNENIGGISEIAPIGRLALGGWAREEKQTSECEIAFLQVFERALEKSEIDLIEHMIFDRFQLREDNDYNFVMKCASNEDELVELPNVCKYAFEICIAEPEYHDIAWRFIQNLGPSSIYFHNMNSKYWEAKGDLEAALRHGFLAFFQEPEDVSNILRLQKMKSLATGEDSIIDWLLVKYYQLLKGSEEEVSEDEISKFSNDEGGESGSLFSFTKHNLETLNSENRMAFFEKLEDFLTARSGELNRVISESTARSPSDEVLRKQIVSLLKNNEGNSKVLRYSTEYFKHNKRRSVGGFADRIKGITTVMILAIVTGRRFEIDWREPFPIEQIFHFNEYDWRVRDKSIEGEKICLIDNHFPMDIRDSLKKNDAEETLGISNDVCEIHCNIYNHSCFESHDAVSLLGDIEILDQSKMVGTLLSLFDYKPNLIEGAMIQNFKAYLDMFEDSIGIQFRTGGDGDWKDPEVDSADNVSKLIEHANEIKKTTGLKTCVFFASDSKELKTKIIKDKYEDLDIFCINIPIAHIDRSEGNLLIPGSRFAIMENFLLSISNNILTGKGAFAVISANRNFQWPWRYHKPH